MQKKQIEVTSVYAELNIERDEKIVKDVAKVFIVYDMANCELLTRVWSLEGMDI